jgi:hypothetical protein
VDGDDGARGGSRDGPRDGLRDGPPPDDAPPPDDWQPTRKRFEPGEWKGRGRRRNAAPEWQSREGTPRAGRSAPVAPERNLVSLLLIHRALVERAAERTGPDAIDDARLRAIFAALVEQGAELPLDELGAQLDEDAQAMCYELVQQDPPVIPVDATPTQAAAELDSLLRQLEERELDRRSAAIDAAMATASPEEKDRLMREKGEISARRRELGGRKWRASQTKRR